tara:strand:- start:145 stop:462 length:318 start_codon:yes stop_codon:yes gene_type:complete
MGLKDGNTMRPITAEDQKEISKFMKQFTNPDGSINDRKYQDYMRGQKALVKLHKSNIDTFNVMTLKFARGKGKRGKKTKRNKNNKNNKKNKKNKKTGKNTRMTKR